MTQPLRKRRPDGRPYERFPANEAKLIELAGLSQDEVLARCEITAPTDPGFVPSECLLHLVRASRQDNGDGPFERLYKALIRRVLARLPRERQEGSEALSSERIREAVLDRFIDLLMVDRAGYDERLDYFEVAFDGGLARLRQDGRRKAWREERRSVPIEEEDGTMTADAERAVGSYDPFATEDLLDAAYRSRLDRAIGDLPREEGEIVEMLRKGFPIESKDPEVMSIVRTLGVVERTVRNRRDRAFRKLRPALREGD